MTAKLLTRAAIIVLSLLVIPLTASAGEAKESYESSDYGYAFEIPQGWTQVPDEALQHSYDYLFEGDQIFEWEVAFEEHVTSPPMSGVYMILQVIPYDKIGDGSQPTQSDIEALLRQMGELDINEAADQVATKEGRQFLHDASMGEVRYDPVRYSYAAVTDIELDDNSVKRGHMRGWFGRHAMVQMTLYTPRDEGDNYEALFARTTGTFEFDEEDAYNDDFWANLPPIARHALVGGLIGALVGLGGVFVKRFTN